LGQRQAVHNVCGTSAFHETAHAVVPRAMHQPNIRIDWFLDGAGHALAHQGFCGSQRAMLKDDLGMAARVALLKE
jgi:hypothetical protein